LLALKDVLEARLIKANLLIQERMRLVASGFCRVYGELRPCDPRG